MKKIMMAWFFTLILIEAAQTLTPLHEIVVKGTAKDIVVDETHLYVGTDQGKLQVYDYQAKQFVKEISLPNVIDFVGDSVPARVFSVDHIEGRFLLLSDSGKGGYSDLWIHENNQTIQLLGAEDKKAVIKARFIDKDHILLGYLSNEAVLYDVKERKERYRVQLSESKFSDFALNEDKSKAVYGCESGVLSVIETLTGKIIKTLKGINRDNTYKVDFKKDTVSAAGQDKRGAIYSVSSGEGDFIEGSFLIYATGLSPSACQVAFAMDERNNISIYNVNTKSKRYLLKGQKSTLNAIIFKDKQTLFSASDDNTVMMWKLK
ncbi:MAG: WD40 repeat domain-containing protein [Sulfurimonas sp.]